MNAFAPDGGSPASPAEFQLSSLGLGASLSWSLELASARLAFSPELARLLDPVKDLIGLYDCLLPASAQALQQALQRLEPLELELHFSKFGLYQCWLQPLCIQGEPVLVQAWLLELPHLEPRDELFNLLAHDVRNALSSIGGFSQLLKRRGLVSEEAGQLVERMQLAASNAHQLLQEMLFAYELKPDARIQPAHLAVKLEATLRWFAIQAREKDISFETQIAEPLPVPAISPDWLERLLKQLLDNALKFTPAGGRIGLALTAYDSPADGKKRARFAVSDTGSGIPAERQARIFAKTAARDQPGGGLGLYLVQQIVQQHGGSVWLESDARGSTFLLELPAL
jgi:signal transduction histidine kinase